MSNANAHAHSRHVKEKQVTHTHMRHVKQETCTEESRLAHLRMLSAILRFTRPGAAAPRLRANKALRPRPPLSVLRASAGRKQHQARF